MGSADTRSISRAGGKLGNVFSVALLLRIFLTGRAMFHLFARMHAYNVRGCTRALIVNIYQ
jgi:hypothetical protein